MTASQVKQEQLGHKSVYFAVATAWELDSLEEVSKLVQSQLLKGWTAKMEQVVDQVSGEVTYVVYFGA